MARSLSWPSYNRGHLSGIGWSRANTQHARLLRASVQAGGFSDPEFTPQLHIKPALQLAPQHVISGDQRQLQQFGQRQVGCVVGGDAMFK
jgi:hypothetical protein